MKPIVDQPIGGDDEESLEQLREINDLLIQIGYANHLIVLASVAILNETDVRPVKTGAIRAVADRMTTETEFSRPNIENSLKALYSREFIDRKKASVGNAYDWSVTAKGRELLAFSLESEVVGELAESDVTTDL